jgi:hypothetical protein
MNCSIQKAIFPYDRSTILNVIYDVVDSLGMTIRHVNSERGKLVVETEEGSSVRITVDTLFPANSTKVDIVDVQESAGELDLVFMDEMRSILNANYHKKTQAVS